ncbi:MAG: D-alanyl-D-alanine carboxypeptidase, partial [Deltaproteobacteria bacterium]|nr:D-alanyl-D-alanine carboxypeptidase [Deltaproteobacteria bacterium]
MRHEGVRQGSRARQRLGVVLWGGLLLLSLLPLPTIANARRATPQAEDAEERMPTKKGARDEKPVPYRSAILMEAETGRVLFEKDAHTPSPPASMVKMMTALIVMERVRDGSLKLSDTVTASRWAAKMGGSQIYLKEGETFTVEDLLKAMMIHSANDATAALAEHVAGSTDAFVDLMNDRAEQLGLKETHYYSVHGLPPAPGQKDDEMSPYDLALLGRELMKFPEVVKWAGTIQEPFRDGQFTLTNPNHLLRQFPGADGIKTGFHNKAGFCVTGTAKRGDLRLIVVVMGSTLKRACFTSAAQLLNQGFANYRMLVPVRQGGAVGRDAPVKGGVAERVPLVATTDVHVLVKKGEEKKVQVEINVPDRVPAPVKAGQVVGEVVVR